MEEIGCDGRQAVRGTGSPLAGEQGLAGVPGRVQAPGGAQRGAEEAGEAELAELLFQIYEGTTHRTVRWSDLDEVSQQAWRIDAGAVLGFLQHARGWRPPETALEGRRPGDG
jgi:hypothetical protein